MFYISVRIPRFAAASILVLLSILCSLPSPVLADTPSFDINYSFGTGSESTESIAVGDVNGDGFLDLIVGNALEQNVVYLNDGLGNFPASSARNFGTGSDWSTSVAVGDMNGDGFLDLVVGNYVQQNMVYLNDGFGNFPANNARNFGTGSDSTESVAVGDVNGDGALDIAVGNRGQQNVVYLNDGFGNFLANNSRNFGTGSNDTESVTLGDVNSDSTLDIIVGNVLQQNAVYLNDKNGNFDWLGSARNFGTGAEWTTSVVSGDIDGDGFLDIIVGNVLQQNVVYLNDKNGNFDWSDSARNFGTGSGSTESMSVGDVNSDGFLDITVGNRGQQNMIYLNDGVGNFSASNTLGFGPDSDMTTSVVVVDVNGDGALDIAVGNTSRQQNVIYLNNGAGSFLVSNASKLGSGSNLTESVAVGDVNGDDALDIAVGNRGQQNLVYINDRRGNFLSSNTQNFGTGSDDTGSIAIGDLDNDGALDIVVGNWDQQNVIYFNDGNGDFLTRNPQNLGTRADLTTSVAIGDMNGDKALDIVVGNWGQQNIVYLNDGSGNFPVNNIRNFGTGFDITQSIAIGDVNKDGSLDIVVGNRGQQNVVYFNDGAGNFYNGPVDCSIPSNMVRCFGPGFDLTESVAIGDINGDGTLDIVVGNSNQQNVVYLNNGSGNFPLIDRRNFGTGFDDTRSVTLGDINGDGDLDIVVGNADIGQRDLVYLNDGYGNFPPSSSRSFDLNSSFTFSVAVGDVNNDGSIDVITGNWGQQSAVHLNRSRLPARLPNNPPYLTITRPITTGNANFYSSPVILENSIIPITYTIFDLEGDTLGRVGMLYSLDGGDSWQPAISTNTTTTNLATSPTGVTYVYNWDTFASGIFGQSDNVVLRLVAYPQPPTTTMVGTYRYINTVAGPFQWPYASATTFPFQVRGTQVQVVNEADQPMPGTIVYRLSAGHTQGGAPLGGSTHPFRTNSQGYLQGRGRVEIGESLLALAPIPLPLSYTERYGNNVRLYYTNGTPIEGGLNTWITNTASLTVTKSGIQQLAVSSANPLLLFDLTVSLEWDASNDPSYLDQLEFDLKRASQFLYDFSNGQAALGQVTIYQNGQAADTADVFIRATNRLRPFAIQGGVVVTPTLDPDQPDLIYAPGRVTMGATWNRYGNPGQNLGQDWPLALAHELSHYFFFLDDVYMGFNDQDLLIPLDQCLGSVMGDMYDPSGRNTEFIFDEEDWQTYCSQTLTERTLQRNEWETLKLWYPHVIPPTTLLSGPSLMPFDLTTISFAPFTPTNTLADPTFFLDYESVGTNTATSSSAGQGIILRDTDNNGDDDTIIDLGSPVGGQNRLLARGARPGDRLCAFDPPHYQFGCEVVNSADERLALKYDRQWTPFIQLSPVSSTTFELEVSGLPLTFTLKARLYPEAGPPSQEIELTALEVEGVYRQQFPSLNQPALAGHVRVWVKDELQHEAIVAFSIGGNPPKSRGAHAPVVSPDGQMIFITRNPGLLPEGEFFSIQSLARLPKPPPGKRAIGPGYNLLATAGSLATLRAGSISFQYLGLDALTEGVNEANENTLTIHFWDGTDWQALPTERNTTYNFASARSQGRGVYALLSNISTPVITTFNPAVVTNNVTTTLAITGEGFLPPAQIRLEGSTTYTLPAVLSGSTLLTTAITPGLSLPAEEYRLKVVNGDEGSAVAPGTLSVFNPDPSACFYDLFDSGANQWQRSGDWNIITFPNSSERAMTDSPAGPYKSAGDYVIGAPTYTTAIISPGFSLVNCPNPLLTFSHDYSIVGGDIARVEISTDNGANWAELANYPAIDLPGLAAQADSLEWANVAWKPVRLDLSGYTGSESVQLRFSLAVDPDVAAKGWVLDNVMVKPNVGNELPDYIFLPIVVK